MGGSYFTNTTNQLSSSYRAGPIGASNSASRSRTRRIFLQRMENTRPLVDKLRRSDPDGGDHPGHWKSLLSAHGDVGVTTQSQRKVHVASPCDSPLLHPGGRHQCSTNRPSTRFCVADSFPHHLRRRSSQRGRHYLNHKRTFGNWLIDLRASRWYSLRYFYLLFNSLHRPSLI